MENNTNNYNTTNQQDQNSNKFCIQNKVEDFNILKQEYPSPSKVIQKTNEINLNYILNNNHTNNNNINRYNNINNYNISNNNYPNNIGIDFHKKKSVISMFTPKPDTEEIPTFTFENDRNINTYKGYIINKSAIIDKNSRNYLEYMKKFENNRRRTPLSSPYSFYQEKNQNSDVYSNYYNRIANNQFNDYVNQLNNNIVNSNLNNAKENKNIFHNNQLTLDTTGNNFKEEQWNDKYYNKNASNQRDFKNNKTLSSSLSANEIFSGRKNEITNPDWFYKRNNIDYFKYKEEQKKYLDYNYEVMMNNYNSHQKKEPNINPYNPITINFEKSKSDLEHNPILNPVNNYGYNKYLQKEIDNNKSRFNSNIVNNRSMSVENNNIHCSNQNDYRNSTLQQAGNRILHE